MAEGDIKMMWWDCPECGHDHIEGPIKRCPKCFYWRTDRVQFYSDSSSYIVTESAIRELGLDPNRLAPDWVCKVCGAANTDEGLSADELICGSCGSHQTNNLDLGYSNPSVLPGIPSLKVDRPKISNNYIVDEETFPIGKPFSPVYQADQFKRDSWAAMFNCMAEMMSDPRFIYGSLIVGGIAGAAGVLTWLAMPRYITGSVVTQNWEVSVEVQEFRPVHHEGWSSPPSTAYNVRSETRQNGTRQVPDGMETIMVTKTRQVASGTRQDCRSVSMGNGLSKESCSPVTVYRTETYSVPEQRQRYRTEPVWDAWYVYTNDEWTYQTTETQTGVFDEPRVAPSISLDNQPYPERLGQPQTRCFVGIDDQNKDDGVRQYSLPCHQYDLLDQGEVHQFKSQMGQLSLVEQDE